MILPDYKNNILNISSTFSKFLGFTDGDTIKILEDKLKKDYTNVVFIVFDGMGVDVLKRIGKGTIMEENICQNVTSVFPATTTNATTTLLTNKLVDYHKYLAWSMYFKNLNRCIDIYMGKDSYTQEVITENYLNTDITPYFKRFIPNRKICSVFPDFIKENTVSENNIVANTIEELRDGVVELCYGNEKKFIYCYCTEPDSTMHEYGVTSKNAIDKIYRIDSAIKTIQKETDNTLIVITADHGHFDVQGYIDLYEDNEVMNCLARPMSMEPRATSFKIKDGMTEQFLYAMEKYKNDITLIKAEDLINKGVFGKNVDDELREYLGDYIGIGTDTYKIVIFHKDKIRFKGHHTGLSEREIYVPLIIIRSKN